MKKYEITWHDGTTLQVRTIEINWGGEPSLFLNLANYTYINELGQAVNPTQITEIKVIPNEF